MVVVGVPVELLVGVVIISCHAVPAVFGSYPEGQLLTQALLCNKEGLLQLVQESCVPDQVRHPAVQARQVPEILTFPVEQLAIHALASNNSTPEHDKQFVVVPLQVAQLTHASHPFPLLFVIYPVGQVTKQLFR